MAEAHVGWSPAQQCIMPYDRRIIYVVAVLGSRTTLACQLA